MAYQQLRIWKHLQQNPGSYPREIVKALSYETRSLYAQLYIMLQRGYVRTNARKSWHTQYWATDLKPMDLRGVAVGSAIGRAIGTAIPKDLSIARAALQAKGYKRRSHRRPAEKSLHVGTPELERCWPQPEKT